MATQDSFYAEEQESDFNLLNFINRYIRYWYLFAITLTASYFGASYYLKKYTEIYLINATLLVKDHKYQKGNEDVFEKFSAVGVKQLENEIAILKSRSLIGKVVDGLGLQVSYWTEGTNRDMELYTDSPIKVDASQVNDLAYGSTVYVQPLQGNRYNLYNQESERIGTYEFGQQIPSFLGKLRVFRQSNAKSATGAMIKVRFHRRDDLITHLIYSMSITPINERSSYLSLWLESSLVSKGKDILNKLLEEYAYTSLEDKNREAANTLRFIEERLKLITRELGSAEENVEEYRRTKGVTDLSSEANLFLQKVEENDAKINEVDIQLKVLAGVERYIEGTQLSNVAPATLMVNDPVLNSYISQLSQLEYERSKLAQSVQPGNPYLETVLSQMANVKQAIKENLNNQQSSLMVTKKSLLALNNRLENSISMVPTKEREFVEIKRQAGIKENLYLLLLRQREETALSYASTVTDSRVIDLPFSNGAPIRPDRQQTFMIAFLLGLVVPALLLFLKESIVNTVQTKAEIKARTGLDVFGEVGVASSDKKNSSIIVDLSSRSFVSEQIRMIRSNLQYLVTHEAQDQAKVILLTSSMSEEGKSFVSLNIAASLALLQKQVLIMGLDLRKPQINKDLNIPNKVGISTYLIGKASAEEIIQPTEVPNLYIAPSGPIPPNPSELLANGRMKQLVDDVRYAFDYIIMDTPPLSLVTDATLLAPFVDVCFYVIRYDRTPKMYLKHIADLNKRKTFPSLNLIFNAVNYKYSSEYAYGYGTYSYYSAKEESKGLISRMLNKS